MTPESHQAIGVHSPRFVSRFRDLSYRLMQFRHWLPAIETAFSYPPPFKFAMSPTADASSLSSRIVRNAALHTLSHAHLVALGAIILLHGMLECEAASHQEIAFRAAKDAAKLISTLESVDDAVLHSSVGVSTALHTIWCKFVEGSHHRLLR